MFSMPVIGSDRIHGGVDYGFGYTGYGYEGGYWRNGAFFYNRTVNNFGGRPMPNVYERAVVNNRNNVSFNGGAGGIQARPTAQQLAFANARHIAPTAIQLQHRQEAARDPSLALNNNHGHPTVAATVHPGVFKGTGVIGAHPGQPVAGVQPQGHRAVIRGNGAVPGNNGAPQTFERKGNVGGTPPTTLSARGMLEAVRPLLSSARGMSEAIHRLVRPRNRRPRKLVRKPRRRPRHRRSPNQSSADRRHRRLRHRCDGRRHRLRPVPRSARPVSTANSCAEVRHKQEAGAQASGFSVSAFHFVRRRIAVYLARVFCSTVACNGARSRRQLFRVERLATDRLPAQIERDLLDACFRLQQIFAAPLERLTAFVNHD